jgi:hypothetical protein
LNCPECQYKESREAVELISEPFEGRTIQYGSRYRVCKNPECRISWYDRGQMQEQLKNRTRALNGK